MNDDDWVLSERENVVAYLKKNVESFNDVGSQPAFFVAPCMAIWAVESSVTKGMVGYWAFSGDLPTDVILRDWSDKSDNPRKALGRIIGVWKTYLPCLAEGLNPENVELGTTCDTRKKLGALLQSRINVLEEWLSDDDLWPVNCRLA